MVTLEFGRTGELDQERIAASLGAEMIRSDHAQRVESFTVLDELARPLTDQRLVFGASCQIGT